MANEVDNTIRVHGSQKKKDQIHSIMKRIETVVGRITAESITDESIKKGLTLDGVEWKYPIENWVVGLEFGWYGVEIRSKYGPANEVQNQLCLLLSNIDQRVVVENAYVREYGPAGKRVITFENGQLVEFEGEHDNDISELISDLKGVHDKLDDENDKEFYKLVDEKIDCLVCDEDTKIAIEIFEKLYKRLPDRETLVEIDWPRR